MLFPTWYIIKCGTISGLVGTCVGHSRTLNPFSVLGHSNNLWDISAQVFVTWDFFFVIFRDISKTKIPWIRSATHSGGASIEPNQPTKPGTFLCTWRMAINISEHFGTYFGMFGIFRDIRWLIIMYTNDWSSVHPRHICFIIKWKEKETKKWKGKTTSHYKGT